MHKLKLESIVSTGTESFHLVFEAPDEVFKSFTMPGQFLELQHQNQKGVFAIACKPESEYIELLIKNSGEVAESICALQPGASIECSEAMGSGFPVDKAQEREVHLFSMGSAIAPFRSLIQGFRAGAYRFSSLTLWQGALTRKHLPFSKEYPQWGMAGLNINVCFDMELGSMGNIWQTLAQKKPDLRNAICFWAGSEAFHKDILRTASSLGLPPENLIGNHQ